MSTDGAALWSIVVAGAVLLALVILYCYWRYTTSPEYAAAEKAEKDQTEIDQHGDVALTEADMFLVKDIESDEETGSINPMSKKDTQGVLKLHYNIYN